MRVVTSIAVVVAATAFTVLEPPGAARAAVFAGGALPADVAPDAPSVGVTLQPRSDGRIRIGFETTLRCSGTIAPVARARTVAWDGATVSTGGEARAPFAGSRVRYAWTFTAQVRGGAMTGAVQVAARRSGRDCRSPGPRTFIALPLPVATGAAARPRGRYGALRRRAPARRGSPARLHRAARRPDGRRVSARWAVAARCRRGAAHRFTNLTPFTAIGEDGRFARAERFRIRYADAVVRYRVRIGGRFAGSAAAGMLRLRATIRSRGGALVTRCDTGRRRWSAGAGGEPPAQPVAPVAPPPGTGGGAPVTPSPDPTFRPDPVVGSWSFGFTSDPGEYLGQGETWQHGSAYGETVNIDVFAAGDIIQFAAQTRDGDANWTGTWSSGDGTPLRTGTYTTPSDGSAGAAWQGYAGDYRGCGRFTGSFSISALAYDASGALRTLRLSFEAHCEGLPEAIRGSFAFDAAG